MKLPLELRQMGASAGPGQIDDYLSCAADPSTALLEEDLIGTEATVFLEECAKGFCRTAQVVVDLAGSG